MQQECKIALPARANAVATNLYSLLVYEDKKSLTHKPYMIFLTGGPGMNHSHYKDYQVLQEVANVIFFDHRGCGLSDRTNATDYTMQNNIDDINIIREHYQQEKIILLGKSYGAMCALGHAIQYPKHIEKLILAAGSPTHKSMRQAKKNASKRHLSIKQRAILKRIWFGKWQSDEEAWNSLAALNTLYSYRVRHGEKVNERPLADAPFAHEVSSQGFKTFLRSFDFTPKLKEVSCPTLVIVGKEDWVTDKKYSVLMHKKIKHSELIVFPKSDHLMEVDVPEQYFNTIKKFVMREK